MILGILDLASRSSTFDPAGADDEPGSAAYMLQLTCFSAPQGPLRVLGSHYVQEDYLGYEGFGQRFRCECCFYWLDQGQSRPCYSSEF